MKMESKHAKCDALRDLVPFAQFKKHEKHPWRKWYRIAQRTTNMEILHY